MPIVTVSSKGQLVIPKKVREALHIERNRKVLIKLEKDRAEIIPVPENPVEAFCGIFEKGPSLTDALLSERGEEKRREEEKASSRFIRPSGLSKKRG